MLTLGNIFVFLLITILQALITLMNFTYDGKFYVTHLYSVPVIIAALFFGKKGAITFSLISIILITSNNLTNPPKESLPEVASLSMFIIMVMFSFTLSRIKTDLSDASDSLNIKSKLLDIQNERLFRLVEISKVLASPFSLKKIYSKLANISALTIEAERSAVIIRDESLEKNKVVASFGFSDKPEAERKLSINDGKSCIFRSIKRKKIIEENSDNNSKLVFPVIFEGIPLGALYFEFIGYKKETNKKTVGRAIADQAAIFMNRAKMYERLKNIAKESLMLADAGQLLISEIKQSDRLRVISEKIAGILDVSKSAVFLVHKDLIKPIVAIGLNKDEDIIFRKAHGKYERIFPNISEIFSRKKPYLLKVNKYAGNKDLLNMLRITSVLIVPLIYEKQIIGVSFFYEPKRDLYLSNDQIEMVHKLADYSAVAVNTAKLYEQISKLMHESEKKAANMRTIFDISQLISMSLRTKTVLFKTIEQALKLFDANIGAIFLYNDAAELLEPQIVIGSNEKKLKGLKIKPGEGLIGATFSSKESHISKNLIHNEKNEINFFKEDIQSAIISPLIARGKSIGVIALYSNKPHFFDKQHLELLTIFATQIALTIDTASLYEEERKIAEMLQRSLLPSKTPKIGNIDVGAIYIPAHLEANVGGDYYDYIIFDDNRVGIVIGDVCGKGISAAADTAMARYYLKAFASRYKDPGKVINCINEMIMFDNDNPQLVSMIYGIVDIDKMEFEYANAGHPPPFIISNALQKVKQLDTTGPIAGAMSDSSYATRKIKINQGDIIFFYTDGLTDVRKKGKIFGEKMLKEILLTKDYEDMNDYVQNIFSYIQSWADNILNDDIAIVGLEIKETG